MKVFLSIAAILAWFFGAKLIFIPAQFYRPTGIQMTPLLATIAKAHGSTLIGLGIIDWLARNANRSRLIAVTSGNRVIQILSLFIVIRTMTLATGSAVAPGLVIHIVLGILFAFFLLKATKSDK